VNRWIEEFGPLEVEEHATEKDTTVLRRLG
jgi:hypothetical protein